MTPNRDFCADCGNEFGPAMSYECDECNSWAPPNFGRPQYCRQCITHLDGADLCPDCHSKHKEQLAELEDIHH